MKIAIIGSGISGLVAAYHLHGDNEITVFEANDYIGGHTHTVSAELDGVAHAVDTGFIVYNDWTYPNFIQLLDELEVETQPTEMSFSVRDERTGLEYNGHSVNTLFAQRRNLFRPKFHRMVRDILRFNRQAIEICSNTTDDHLYTGMTIGSFLENNGYSAAFRNHYLLPMGAAIWSCPTGTFADFPVRFIAEFYKNHGLLSIKDRPTWRVIKGGSQSYVRAMVRGFRDRIRLNTPVRNVTRTNHGVVVWAGSDHEEFDHVVFACHSDQALKILDTGATDTEISVLSEFPYSKNLATLHTDETLLPKCRRAWASWNYLVSDQAEMPASVTYNMSLLQQIESAKTFCLTLNGDSRISSEKVLASFEYHHPIFTINRAAAQARHHELLNANRTSFCGAYWGNGFHEDGVVSGLAVVNALSKQTSKGDPGHVNCDSSEAKAAFEAESTI